VIVDPQGRVVVVRQRARTWSLPKGHVEAGEGVLDAARREIDEECGLVDLELVCELGPYTRWGFGHGLPERKTITLFLFRSPEAALQPRDPANPEARWVPQDEVAGRSRTRPTPSSSGGTCCRCSPGPETPCLLRPEQPVRRSEPPRDVV
jgi:ADP-ribose pyrophosphatase YjhB (NUDIX family)